MRRDAAVVAAAVVVVGMGGSAASAQQSTPEGLAFFHLSESGDGRISFESSENQRGVQVLSGVTIAGEDGEVQAEEIRISGARETNDGVVFDSLEILNLTGETEESSAPEAPRKGTTKTPAAPSSDSPGTFRMERFVVERPNAPLAAMIAQAFSLEGVDDDVEWGKPSDYSFETIAMEGVSFEGPDGVFGFETLSLGGFTGEALASFAFQNLTGTGSSDGTEVVLELGSWTMNGLNLDGIDAFAEVDPDDEEGYQEAFNAAWADPYKKRYDDYALEGLRIDVDGVLIGLESLAGRIDERRGALSMNDTLSGLTVEFDDSEDMGAQGLAGLQMLGYDRIEINGHSVMNADPSTDRVSTDEYSLTATDALALEIDYDIGGFGEYMQAATELGIMSGEDIDDPAVLVELLGPLMVHNFELRLTDDSLVERALQAAADSQGSTPEAMRQQAIAFMTIGTMMSPPGAVQTLVSEAIGAASSFLEEPGTLRISVKPDQPVSVAELISAFESSDYDTALSLLNVEVTAE